MALGKHLLVLALVALLASVSEAKGTLRVDNIVAIEAPIVVDALLGGELPRLLHLRRRTGY